jgi:hypothetical protein
VIGRVVSIGDNVARVLSYLFGPGRRNEHVNPRLVAAWDDPADLKPPVLASGRRSFRRLTGLLEEPVAALGDRAPGDVRLALCHPGRPPKTAAPPSANGPTSSPS